MDKKLYAVIITYYCKKDDVLSTDVALIADNKDDVYNVFKGECISVERTFSIQRCDCTKNTAVYHTETSIIQVEFCELPLKKKFVMAKINDKSDKHIASIVSYGVDEDEANDNYVRGDVYMEAHEDVNFTVQQIL